MTAKKKGLKLGLYLSEEGYGYYLFDPELSDCFIFLGSGNGSGEEECGVSAYDEEDRLRFKYMGKSLESIIRSEAKSLIIKIDLNSQQLDSYRE